MENMAIINYAQLIERSQVNGPGNRAVIWVQGCPIHCFGCANKEFQPFIKNKSITVEEMAEKILSIKELDGITYSGGEPFCQARPLAELAKILKAANNSFNIITYTGYTIEEIRRKNRKNWNELLSITDLPITDLLIDGRFIQELADKNLYLRGSSNQKLHYLTDKIPKRDTDTYSFELHLTLDGLAKITGFIP